MKFALIISTAIYTAAVVAAPGAVSLNRASRTITVRDDNNVENTVQIACVECPCEGWDGPCYCIDNGCCCGGTAPPQPTATGW